MSATVKAVYDFVDLIAPFQNALDFDNVGLLTGSLNQPVTRVLVSLDVTMQTVNEAKAIGAELILSHHPLFFHGRKNLAEGDPEADTICALVRNSIALVSAHTNLDLSPFSGSACCAKGLDLRNIHQDGLLFTGDCEPQSAAQMGEKIRTLLHAPLRVYGEPSLMLNSLSICGGAYGEGWKEALALGAKAYLTGEIGHHDVLDAVQRGMVIFEGGHFATEQILISNLAGALQNAMNELQCDVRVFPSACVSYHGALE